MTQRIFDVENEKDMQDLWDILPDNIVKIKQRFQDGSGIVYYTTTGSCVFDSMGIIKINWHDKTEITRPIQEATEADIGKLCYFWDYDDEDYSKRIGLLTRIYNNQEYTYTMSKGESFNHSYQRRTRYCERNRRIIIKFRKNITKKS